jgi:hypothetical protein
MKVKAIISINGKDIETTIDLPNNIINHTGYGFKTENDIYYFVDGAGDVYPLKYEKDKVSIEAMSNAANLYTNESLAKDDARADKLMRQLRQFAVNNRKPSFHWRDLTIKYSIVWKNGGLTIIKWDGSDRFGEIYFDTSEIAAAAIEKFKDELTWYFMEYV